MNKIRADQALAAIEVIEEKIVEIKQIAQKEIKLINSWEAAADNETAKTNFMACLESKRLT